MQVGICFIFSIDINIYHTSQSTYIGLICLSLNRDNADSPLPVTTRKYSLPPHGEEIDDDDDDREDEDEEFDITTTTSTSSVSPSTVKLTSPATTPTMTPTMMKTTISTSVVKTTIKVPHVPAMHFTPIPVYTTPSADILNEEDIANRDVEEDVANGDVTHDDGNVVTSKVEDHSLDYSLDYFLEKVFNITKPYDDQYSGYVSLLYIILL